MEWNVVVGESPINFKWPLQLHKLGLVDIFIPWDFCSIGFRYHCMVIVGHHLCGGMPMACSGEWPRVHVVLGILGQRTGTETPVFDCVKAAKIISRAAKGVRAVARI